MNGDELPDIFMATGDAGSTQYDAQLYLNDGHGAFTDASENIAATQGRDLYSVASGDYDRDGDLDVYLGAHPRSMLLQNDGTGVFTDVTLDAMAGGLASSAGSGSKIGAFGDYDGDGWLDIAVVSEQLHRFGS